MLKTIGQILGENIRQRRKALGHTQETLSALIKVPYRTFQSIEAGDSWPEMSNLLKIAHGLDVHPAVLFVDLASVTPDEAITVLAKAHGFEPPKKIRT